MTTQKTETSSISERVVAAVNRQTPPPPTPKAKQSQAVHVMDDVDQVLSVDVDTEVSQEVQKPESDPVPASVDTSTQKAQVVIPDNAILENAGALAIHEAIKAAKQRANAVSGRVPVFKVAALASGYTGEMTALNYEDIARLQSSSLDPYSARMKTLRTVYNRISNFSCGHMTFDNWRKQTADSDYNSLMYGLYAATYPGKNEFDVPCQHCSHVNKVIVDVNDMPRAEDPVIFGEQLSVLLDPNTDYKGALVNSLVGRRVQHRLPESGFIIEVTVPSIQDHLDGVQWFTQAVDRTTGMLPDDLVGSESIRAATMYINRILIPNPGNESQFFPITDQGQRASIISDLSAKDSAAMDKAIIDSDKSINVAYSIPDFNCGRCGKRNSKLELDFEALLFTKLREKV